MTDQPAPQDAYHAYRRQWAEEVAQILPTAKPWPKYRPNTWKIRPAPGTIDDSETGQLILPG